MKNLLLIGLFFLAFFACSISQNSSSDELPEDQTALIWAKFEKKKINTIDLSNNHTDLKAFDPIIKQARIVAFGESDHNLHEQTQFRLRLFEYLVREKGFTHFVAESGFLEGRIIDQYIQGEGGFSNYEEVMHYGFTHSMGPWEEMKAIINWMRDYNLDPANSNKPKLHYYGVDEPVTGTSIYYPLEYLKEYLEKVDPKYVASSNFSKMIAIAKKSNRIFELAENFFLQNYGSKKINPDFLDSVCGFSYRELTGEEQKFLAKWIKNIANRIKIRRLKYMAESSESDYLWYAQIAQLCTQLIRTQELRLKYPYNPYDATVAGALGLNYTPPADEEENKIQYFQQYFHQREGKEMSLRDNLAWILNQSTKNKIFFVAHNGHIQKVILNTGLGLSKSAGVLLKEKFGKNYVAIASTMNHLVDKTSRQILEVDEYGNPIPKVSENPNCIEYIFSQAEENEQDGNILLFNLQNAPAWFDNDKREIRYQFPFRSMNVKQNFDGVLYFTNASRGVRME